MPSLIDEQFYCPRLPVNIVALPNSDYEVHPLRNLLEGFNCVVTVHWIGTPADFLKVLGQGQSAPPYLLIAGHGDTEKGFYLGEYIPEIDTSMLVDQHLPAAVIAPLVNLPGCTVISSACSSGVESMGRAFTATGKIAAYLACQGDPNAEDMFVFLVNFFHGIMRKKLSSQEACQRAVKAVENSVIDQMRVYLPEAKESQQA